MGESKVNRVSNVLAEHLEVDVNIRVQLIEHPCDYVVIQRDCDTADIIEYTCGTDLEVMRARFDRIVSHLIVDGMQA